MTEWQTGKPPNEVPVEVEDENGEIIVVKAFYGRDGYRPHWRALDDSVHWAPSAFRKWRLSKFHVAKEVMES